MTAVSSLCLTELSSRVANVFLISSQKTSFSACVCLSELLLLEYFSQGSDVS